MGNYSLRMIIGSIIAGIIAFGVGEVIYGLFDGVLPTTVVTLLYFLIVFVIIGILIFVLQGMISSKFRVTLNKKQLVLTIIGIILGSFIFEFLYGLEIHQEKDANAYIFVIDNSGSMAHNDPDGQRYKAIENLLADKSDDFRYAIYAFSDYTTLLRPMGPKSDGFSINYDDYGQTFMGQALTDITKDINDHKIDAPKGTVVILLSDGLAMDIDTYEQVEEIVKPYTKRGMVINSVGLALGEDGAREVLEAISEAAGGVCIDAENVNKLNEALLHAGVKNINQRNLLNYRDGVALDWLYMILRIVFVALLGLDIAIMKSVLCEKFIDTSSVLKVSAICSIIAGIVMEVGINMLGLSMMIVHLIVCILLAFTLLRKDLFFKKSESDFLEKSQSGF